MTREAGLFEEAGGDPLEGFLLLKASGGNVPPLWVDRARESRRNRHKQVAEALKKSWTGIGVLRDWEESYAKECFYNGIRILFELERNGRSAR